MMPSKGAPAKPMPMRTPGSSARPLNRVDPHSSSRPTPCSPRMDHGTNVTTSMPVNSVKTKNKYADAIAILQGQSEEGPHSTLATFGVRWLDTALALSFCAAHAQRKRRKEKKEKKERKKAVSSHRTRKLPTHTDASSGATISSSSTAGWPSQ